MATREDFSRAAESGKVLAARCPKCSALHLAMTRFCPACGSRGLVAEEVEGRGTVATYTIITVAPEGFEGHTPYAWVVMAIDGTPLRVSGFMAGVASPADLPVGTRVRVAGHDERGVLIERS
ncbi:MAG: OB-fold domain-containing protein [Thaumarchaeota archaeon]|nr:OB-fold domain-containing protein [Nitrososphaerota archaeon]RNJ71608.1 MAG: nucleotide-binding protein [Thaumarchaeota archaeon S13]RNJ72653.1 MAG: nucleotide-binding protein [Thaumarchaeota archaeon S15]RNJ73189.1 MAG: nucleotide-binding protein [Thaumarchaeota archaeon S14]MDD9813520.1 OB-fold domain-containing protein [Nitrososphaerota archaeon]